MHGVREHPRHRGINKRSLGLLPEKDPSGLHDTCVHYSIVKEQARDLREFGFFGPNRETIEFDCSLSMQKVLRLFRGPDVSVRARTAKLEAALDRAVVRQN